VALAPGAAWGLSLKPVAVIQNIVALDAVEQQVFDLVLVVVPHVLVPVEQPRVVHHQIGSDLLQQPVTDGGVIVIVTRRWECCVRPYSEQWEKISSLRSYSYESYSRQNWG
jgi:hypothetical protein